MFQRVFTVCSTLNFQFFHSIIHSHREHLHRHTGKASGFQRTSVEHNGVTVDDEFQQVIWSQCFMFLFGQLDTDRLKEVFSKMLFYVTLKKNSKATQKTKTCVN